MLEVLKKTDLIIPENRQRKERDPQYIVDLANSIQRIGLMHPITIRRNGLGQALLVAGECRSEAIEQLWMMGEQLRCGGKVYEEGYLPAIDIRNLDPIDAFEAELEENIRRRDLSWQDKATATSQLFELRKLQAEKKGEKPPTVMDIAREVRDASPEVRGSAADRTRKEIILAKHMENEEVKKAKTIDEAFKILKRQEELARSAELGRQVGATFTASVHQLFRCDSLAWMSVYNNEPFDIILTDPIYGIDAHEFSDSGGKTKGAHFYTDDYKTWTDHMAVLSVQGYRITKPQAHLYAFCDIDRFVEMKGYFERAGWKVFRTPIVWVNPTAMRAPWPQHGPQRKYQLILYAMKGDKHVNKLYPDVIVAPSDVNLNHHAQKPVGLFVDLLLRSCAPSNSVLDPFCGSGTIFPAAHQLKVRATGLEIDESAYGIAVKRLEELK